MGWPEWASISVGSVVLVSVSYLLFSVVKEKQDRDIARCQAAQQTILDEAEMIAAGGKFPGEKITDRWKALLWGC